VDACLPKDEAGNFISEQERSDVVHELHGGQSGGPNAKDKAAKLLRARLRELFGGAQEERQEAASRSGQTRARRGLKAEFEGSLGKLGPLRELIRQKDELIDATVYRLYGLTEEEIGIVRGETH
jgi:hypothetical protein